SWPRALRPPRGSTLQRTSWWPCCGARSRRCSSNCTSRRGRKKRRGSRPWSPPSLEPIPAAFYDRILANVAPRYRAASLRQREIDDGRGAVRAVERYVLRACEERERVVGRVVVAEVVRLGIVVRALARERERVVA